MWLLLSHLLLAEPSLLLYRASGTSHAAYWIGNFLWDGSLLVGYVLLFVAVLALFNPSVYTGAHYGEIVLPGLLCAIAVVFRFYSVSYFIPDVRMVQSLYFYGSLAVMYVLLQVRERAPPRTAAVSFLSQPL